MKLPDWNLRGKAIRLASSFRRRAETLTAKTRHTFGGGPAPIKFLLLSDGLSAQSEAQFDPILRNRSALLRDFGLIVDHRHLNIDRPPTAKSLAPYDLIAFKLYYKTPPEAVPILAEQLRENMRPESRLIYCDGNDEMTIQWPGLLHSCDLYWKKHALRDRSGYLRRYRGSTNLTDHALGDEAEAPAAPPPGEADLGNLFCGASIGLDRKIANLAPLLEDSADIPPQSARKYDVVLRANVPDNWMGRLRRPAVEALRPLENRLAVLLPEGRVSPGQYAQEMTQSRICLSPFGYGEICWRDFEAVAYGCLLFKPSMDHVESRPDIFQAFETYVPVAWDFSDLGEKLDHYLAHPEESARIIGRARQVLRESLRPAWYVQVVREMLDHLASVKASRSIPFA